MQQVTQTFDENSKKPNRRPSYDLNIDWTNTGYETNEMRRVLLIEVERAIAEPQGGIQTAVANLRLNNIGNRYTPR